MCGAYRITEMDESLTRKNTTSHINAHKHNRGAEDLGEMDEFLTDMKTHPNTLDLTHKERKSR